MCIMLSGEDVHIMSAIVAVCSNNFCTFVADRRMVLPDESGVAHIANDETEKIFKVNRSVLFGATGLFYKWESLTAPLDGRNDLKNMSGEQVKEAVTAYLGRSRSVPLLPRNYLVGGWESDRFVIYEIHYDGTASVSKRSPAPPVFNFALSVSLPRDSSHLAPQVQSMIAMGIHHSSSHNGLVKSLEDSLAWVAQRDNTVGPTHTTLTITRI